MPKNIWKCSNCDHVVSRYMAKCLKCGSFTMKEEAVIETASPGLKSSGAIAPTVRSQSIDMLSNKPERRIVTGIGELDRVLGGGFVAGEVVLFAGSPGAGKALANSTLIHTPFGLRRIDEISVGDFVLDGSGQRTRVMGIMSPEVTKAYRIDFGIVIVDACADHLWLIDICGTEFKLNTEQLYILFEVAFRVPLRVKSPSGTYRVKHVRPIIPSEGFTCIEVDSIHKTFLCTDIGIRTHNSTLSLSMADSLASETNVVLYSSGEESEQQIGLRAKRMGVTNPNIKVINETSLERLLGHIEADRPGFLIVDSLQTIASADITGSIGSITQSKEVAHNLTRIAKSKGLTMLLINQVTKGDEFAGSNTVNHIVDCTLMLESDRDSPIKTLRALKNRFGATDEVGLFAHASDGLKEIADPSGMLIDNQAGGQVGACVTLVSEGIRNIPVEVQALVTKSTLANPRKQFSGVLPPRGQIISAIVDKFCMGRLWEHDLFVSTVSGIKVFDPQADIAVAMAIISSQFNKPVRGNTVFVGELGLTGQVRGRSLIDNKIRDAERLGFECIVVPDTASNGVPKGTKIRVEFVAESSELKRFLA